MQNFTTLQERIDKRALEITEALQREIQSLEQVEQTLNKRYSESVTNVLNSLRSNMDEQEKKLIKHKMQEALKLITEEMTTVLKDWANRMDTTRKSLTEVRQQILKEEELTLKLVQDLNKEVSQTLESQTKLLQKMNVRTAITPALMLLTLVGGIAIGWYLQKPKPKIVEKIVEKKVPIKTVWTIKKEMQREDEEGYYVRVEKEKVYSEKGSSMKWVMIRSK